nr:hypothetical protein [uncultured Albidiferax sp.]
MTSAGSGPIRVQTTADASRSCVELAAEDFGPGIPDVPLALHAPASCLEARRKVLQVLLEVEGHAELDAVRCTPIRLCCLIGTGQNSRPLWGLPLGVSTTPSAGTIATKPSICCTPPWTRHHFNKICLYHPIYKHKQL